MPHSLRAGCAVTLSVVGGLRATEGIMNHVGWSTDASMAHYLRQPVVTGDELAVALSAMADSKAVQDRYTHTADVVSMPPAFS